jgi:hypothetical protein
MNPDRVSPSTYLESLSLESKLYMYRLLTILPSGSERCYSSRAIAANHQFLSIKRDRVTEASKKANDEPYNRSRKRVLIHHRRALTKAAVGTSSYVRDHASIMIDIEANLDRRL